MCFDVSVVLEERREGIGVVSIGKVYVRENEGKCWQIISKERERTERGREGGRARGKEGRRVVGRERKKERESEILEGGRERRKSS